MTKQQFKAREEFRRRAIHAAIEVIESLSTQLAVISTMTVAGDSRGVEALVNGSTESVADLLRRGSYTSSALRQLCNKQAEVFDYSHPLRVELAWQQQFKGWRRFTGLISGATTWLLYPVTKPVRLLRQIVRSALRSRWIGRIEAEQQAKSVKAEEVPDGEE